jgi:hypothetical protein
LRSLKPRHRLLKSLLAVVESGRLVLEVVQLERSLGKHGVEEQQADQPGDEQRHDDQSKGCLRRVRCPRGRLGETTSTVGDLG